MTNMVNPKYIGIDILDQYQCACGWKTKTYYDGEEYAKAEWKKHLEKCPMTQPTPLWQWED
jgi:hypothetical protein